MRKFSSCKEISALVSIKISQGWSFQNGKKHGKLISPFGLIIMVPGSPSDRRAFQNFKRGLRGLERGNCSEFVGKSTYAHQYFRHPDRV